MQPLIEALPRATSIAAQTACTHRPVAIIILPGLMSSPRASRACARPAAYALCLLFTCCEANWCLTSIEDDTAITTGTGMTSETGGTSTSESTVGVTETSGPDLCGNDVCDVGEAAMCPNDCGDCGDGVVDGSEACDDGPDNGEEYSPMRHCNASCDGYAPHCGDAVCRPRDETSTNCPQDCTAPMCGNGVTEAGEQCDAGVGGTPMESAQCDDDCTTPMCGDGNDNPAADEQCDDGNNDNSDACLDACVAAICGDGFVQAGIEDCDDANDIETDECDADCNVIEHRRVFVTSTTVTGKFGGLAGADMLCQTLGGATNYKAWLSDSMAGPVDRLDTSFPGIYELTDGQIVAGGWADLIDGDLEHAIDQTEAGDTVGATAVWSNTNFDGAPLGTLHCVDWTDNTFNTKGSYGASDAMDAVWTNAFDDQVCSSPARIYCFEDL